MSDQENPYKEDPPTNFKDIDELNQDEAEEEVERLRQAIRYHDYRYYIKNDPVISDEAYDKLFTRLEELEGAFPDLEDDNSPTKRIGVKPIDELETVEHNDNMFSLNSYRDGEEIKNFLKDLTSEDFLIIEPKLDGLSVEVVYEDGEFDHGATRGDGVEGEDISENLKTINTLPLQLRDKELPQLLSVRGEVLMTRKGFQDINKKKIEKDEEPYANPRNAAAGIIRRLESKKVADKPLEIYIYEILDIEGKSFTTHQQELDYFEKWGLQINLLNKKIKVGNLENTFQKIKNYREDLGEKREDLDYEIDGIVIKVNNLKTRQELGNRERSPRWAAAWKFPSRKKKTIIKDIVVQVGRTGQLTPVALLEPVDIGGVTVSRATLHNEDEVQKKDLRINDKVKIERAGDVIPEIVEKIEESSDRGEPFSMPDRCPVCQTEVIKKGANYFCPADLSCPAQLERSILHYASREAADIEHLGQETVEQLVEKNLVNSLVDLYQLEKDDLLDLEGFSNKSADNLYQAIQSSKKVELNNFLYGLGIRHVGNHLARVVAINFGSLKAVIEANYQQLIEIDEIGPEVAESIAEFFKRDKNMKMINGLKEEGVEILPFRSEEDKLENTTIVLTGQLDDYTREEAKEKIEALGGRATSSISGKTDYLVVGDNPGNKLDEAKEEDVEIIDEQQFQELING